MESLVRSSAKLILVLVAALCPASAIADYVFRAVEYPSPTVLTDNSLWGITSGANAKLMGHVSLDGINGRSFKYEAGSSPTGFTLIPLPAGETSIGGIGINEAGVIVGSLADGATGIKAFVLEGGVYTFYTRPGWEATEFRSINDTGLITGWSWHMNPDGSIGSPDGIIPASTGFIFNRATGVYTDFSVPGASVQAWYITHGINNAGQAVGSANFYDVSPGNPVTRPIRHIGFLREADGTIHTFVVDDGSPRTRYTKARGINDNGLIAGTTLDANNKEQVFVGTSAGYQILPVPNAGLPDAVSAFAEGVGHDGQVIGIWWDAAGNSRGFMATPAALPTGTTTGGAFTFSVAVVPDTPIFIDPPVALAYDYAIGKNNPRFGTVRLPIGVGDSKYLLVVGKKVYSLSGGQLFDFRTDAKKKKGVSSFRVACIDTAAGLDPANPMAFPTEVSFVAGGTFTGSQKPLTEIRSRGRTITDRAKCFEALLRNGGDNDDGEHDNNDD